jgi:DNA-directed RNA polymerase subunit beta'
MNRAGIMAVVDDKGREKERYPVVYGARITVDDGAPVKGSQILLEWDPYTFSILTEVSGVVHFKDLVDGLTMQEQVDEVTGMSQLVVTDSPDEKRQPMVVVRPEGAAGSRSEAKKYLMPTKKRMPATCWPRSRAKPPRPRTSPAVCRAWWSYSKPASRVKPPSSPKSTAS